MKKIEYTTTVIDNIKTGEEFLIFFENLVNEQRSIYNECVTMGKEYIVPKVILQLSDKK